MSVPEAAVYENYGMVFFQDYIGSTRKFFYVDTISESVGEKVFADYHFRLGILSPDTGHAFVSLFFCQLVSHVAYRVLPFPALSLNLPLNSICIVVCLLLHILRWRVFRY